MSGVAVRGFMAAMILLVVGGLAWGFMAFKTNPVAKVLGKRAWIVYALVGLAAVFVLVGVGRNAFLPFLGPTVFPCSLLKETVPEGADTTVQVYAKPGAKVLYWASEPANEELKVLNNWREAYLEYKNAGVVLADENGMATLRVRKPQAYSVPTKGRLESHVHYRMCLNDGALSQIETHMVSSEEFQSAPSQIPEMPVVAPEVVPDIPAVPEVPTVSEPPRAVEGFEQEELYGIANAPAEVQSLHETVEPVDPRLERLKSVIESESATVFDSMGYEEGPVTIGTSLDAAFGMPLKAPAPSV
jgi:uncharacterized membrane protein YuzA (DUF378 family)